MMISYLYGSMDIFLKDLVLQRRRRSTLENGGIHDSLENVLALELLELPFSSAGDQP